jgi:hypothetical protein
VIKLFQLTILRALLEEQEANLLAKMHKKYSERSKGRDITG